MITIKEIAFTGYPITDAQRARDFYEGILGLKPATTFDHEGRVWIEYELGASTIAITNMSSETWKPGADGPSIAFEVADFDGAIVALRKANVRFGLEPIETPVCRLAVILDPDGNSITVHQRKA